MARKANTDRIEFLRPRADALKRIHDEKRAIEEMEKAEEDAAYDGFVRLFSDADVRWRAELFANPIEKFVALTDYKKLVYGWLVDNWLDTHGCLVYVMNKEDTWTVVYVYDRKTPHQEEKLLGAFPKRYGDWRLVPESNSRCYGEGLRRAKCAWELWVFHHYFSFPWFPEGDY